MKNMIIAVLLSFLLIGIMYLNILPVKATGEPEYQYVTQQSNVDGSADMGIHSSFSAQQAGPDQVNDTLTEANFPATYAYSEDFVDYNTTNIDGITSIGGQSNFTTQKYADNLYDTLTEEDTDTGTSILGDNSGSGTNYVSVSANTMYGGVYTASASGEVQSAVFYGRNNGFSGTISVKAVITNSSGYILTNGVSGALSVSTTAGTKTCLWSGSKPIVENGQTYWISIIPDGTLRFYYDSTTGGNSRYDSSNSYSSPTNPTDATSGTYTWRLCYANVNNLNYSIDIEEQFTGVTFNSEYEYICVKTGTLNAEALKLEVWNGSWNVINSSLVASAWNNISISTYLTSNTLYIRFTDGTQSNDASKGNWNIDEVLLQTYNTTNYRLDIEEQITNANYTRANRELCIYMGPYSSPAEQIYVQWRNTTDNTWVNITGLNSLTANQWNNASVTTYLTSNTFTIRFLEGVQSGDTVQSTWQIDCVLLHTWDMFNLNLRVRDWDLTDNIQGAIVYKDSNTQISDANGWANWTGLSGTVQIKVSYYGFWVNGTFSVTMDSDKTITVQCRLYDATVMVQEGVQNAYLTSANVTVYNSTSEEGNKITSGLTGNKGQVQLLNLPNSTMTFTQYGGASYSLLIGNTTQLVSSENQAITLTADQNNVSASNGYSIVAFA